MEATGTARSVGPHEREGRQSRALLEPRSEPFGTRGGLGEERGQHLSLSRGDHGEGALSRTREAIELRPDAFDDLGRARIDFLAHADVVAQKFGAPAAGKRFPCPIPGHGDTAQFATPPEDPDGDLRLLCDCLGEWRALGHVEGARCYGRDTRPWMSAIESALWSERLAFRLGLIQPSRPLIPMLPADVRAPRLAEEVRRGFMLLVGLRFRDGAPIIPVPFSVSFARAYIGAQRVGMRSTTHRAIRFCIDAGCFHVADHMDTRDGWESLPLYLPGGGVR